MVKQVYDDFSIDYDKFVNWESRLEYELPFIESLIKPLDTKPKVLDVACGTGMHAIALAKLGFEVAGADISGGMVAQARANARLVKLKLRFEQAGFGELSRIFGEGKFDAVLCLGNSLPHVLKIQDLNKTLADFANCLRPGGMIIIQNRNFDAVLEQQERWMEPQAYSEGGREWLFLRFYEYKADGTINFNIVTLQKDNDGVWSQTVTTTQLRPYLKAEIEASLEKANFDSIQTFGDMSGSDFNRLSSGNLVITAIRQRRI